MQVAVTSPSHISDRETLRITSTVTNVAPGHAKSYHWSELNDSILTHPDIHQYLRTSIGGPNIAISPGLMKPNAVYRFELTVRNENTRQYDTALAVVSVLQGPVITSFVAVLVDRETGVLTNSSSGMSCLYLNLIEYVHIFVGKITL